MVKAAPKAQEISSEIRWQAYESAGVQPVFLNKEDAIDYATGRACFRSGEIRILDSSGNVERVIPFDDANRKL
jgi:hypothetical protein